MLAQGSVKFTHDSAAYIKCEEDAAIHDHHYKMFLKQKKHIKERYHQRKKLIEILDENLDALEYDEEQRLRREIQAKYDSVPNEDKKSVPLQ